MKQDLHLRFVCISEVASFASSSSSEIVLVSNSSERDLTSLGKASIKLSSCDRKVSFFTLSPRISLIISSAFSGTLSFLSLENHLGSKHAKSSYNCLCLRNRIFRFSTMLSIKTLKVFTLYSSSSPETL